MPLLNFSGDDDYIELDLTQLQELKAKRVQNFCFKDELENGSKLSKNTLEHEVISAKTIPNTPPANNIILEKLSYGLNTKELLDYKGRMLSLSNTFSSFVTKRSSLSSDRTMKDASIDDIQSNSTKDKSIYFSTCAAETHEKEYSSSCCSEAIELINHLTEKQIRMKLSFLDTIALYQEGQKKLIAEAMALREEINRLKRDNTKLRAQLKGDNFQTNNYERCTVWEKMSRQVHIDISSINKYQCNHRRSLSEDTCSKKIDGFDEMEDISLYSHRLQTVHQSEIRNRCIYTATEPKGNNLSKEKLDNSCRYLYENNCTTSTCRDSVVSSQNSVYFFNPDDSSSSWGAKQLHLRRNSAPYSQNTKKSCTYAICGRKPKMQQKYYFDFEKSALEKKRFSQK